MELTHTEWISGKPKERPTLAMKHAQSSCLRSEAEIPFGYQDTYERHPTMIACQAPSIPSFLCWRTLITRKGMNDDDRDPAYAASGT